MEGESEVVRLSPRAERAIAELIARYDLHAEGGLPVPIRQVARDEGWVVRYSEEMRQLYGVAVVLGDVRVIAVNARVAEPYQRLAIAHELGHALNGDPGQLQLCAATGSGPLRGWLWSREEQRASLAAARLLIPDWVARAGATADEIAAQCVVPTELVDLWWASAGRRLARQR